MKTGLEGSNATAGYEDRSMQQQEFLLTTCYKDRQQHEFDYEDMFRRQQQEFLLTAYYKDRQQYEFLLTVGSNMRRQASMRIQLWRQV